jgi:predicted metallopeptidase
MEWEEAKDVKNLMTKIVNVLDLNYIDSSRIFCFRTKGSKSRSYARVWAFPKIFQEALGIKPAYVIEVLSKYFDKLGDEDKDKVIIHELLHIPKNFSGSLLPHRGRKRNLGKLANKLFEDYKRLL